MTAALPHDRGQGLVDTYLDEMFELLAGTGAEGRRLLAETEDHLTEAVAEGRARGLDAETAERDAITRFGAPAVVVRRLPVTRTVVRVDLRPLLVGAWALAGAFLTWYGLSGALTWLLSWPWTRLLIATDRFGSSAMCEPSPIWREMGGCLAAYQQEVALVPYADNDFPYLIAGGAGLFLLLALLFARRLGGLGTPPWTPPRRATGLVFAILFGLGGLAMIIEGVHGITLDVQYYVLGEITAGLLAAGLGVAALRHARRS